MMYEAGRRRYMSSRTSLSRIARWARSYYYAGSSVQCPFCNGRFRRFLPTGVLERPFWQGETGRALLGLDGITVCDRQCPRCGSSERHRLAYFYLKDALRFDEMSGISVLDVGPDEFLTRALFDKADIDYVSIDLVRGNATRRMDVTDLDFEDDTFDCLICYHVLEHVREDTKAMSELLRVMKPGGWGILQVPIWSEVTFEDEAIPREEYLEYYGHKDHVRRYGHDYKERLESVGFEVKVDDYVRRLPKQFVRRYGLLEDEDIYYCEKVGSRGQAAPHR